MPAWIAATSAVDARCVRSMPVTSAAKHGPIWRMAIVMATSSRGRRARPQPPRSWAGSALLDGDAPVNAVFLGRIVPGRPVIGAPVVPDDDIALAPRMPVLRAGLNHALGQLLDELVALRELEAPDPQDLAGVEV